MVTTRQHTATDLVRLGSDAERFELIKGELRDVAAAGARHGVIGGRLIILLGAAAARERLGEFFTSDTGFIVTRDPDSVLVPDIGFVQADRLPGDLSDGFVPCAPDLAVEIESPSNREGEMLEKVGLYLSGGSRLVWLIRPRHLTITVFSPDAPERVLTNSDTLDGADVIPGFALSVAELFRGILR